MLDRKITKTGTILILSGTGYSPDKKHLFVICNELSPDGSHLIVPICTWTNDLCDPTCKLAPHEHPFIKTNSNILYRKARIVDVVDLQKNVDLGIFQLHEPFNGQTFLKIVNGICKSHQTPYKIKKYFGCN